MFERFKNAKVVITDKEIINGIQMNGIIEYLEENGWCEEECEKDESILFEKNGTRITVSAERNIPRDFENILHILSVIEEVEGENQLAILDEIYDNQEFVPFFTKEFGDEEESEEEDKELHKKIEKMKKEYEKELKHAVREAKAYNESLYNGPNPLWEHGRVIAVFRKYWLLCKQFSDENGGCYNPKWLAHEDLDGELYDIISDMPFYPIGADEQGRSC